MSGLRAKLIEAAARSMYESSTRELRELEAPLIGDRFEFHAHAYRQYAARVLDVFLDTLSENAKGVGDEMERAFSHANLRSEDIIGYGRGRERSQILVLVAALRDVVEEE